MSDIPNYIIDKLNSSNLSKNTIINYTYHIKKFLDVNSVEDMNNLEKIDEYNKNIPISGREGFLLAIIQAYDAYYEKNRQKLRQMIRESKDESLIESIKKLNNDKKEKITYENVKEIADKKQKNTINDLIAKLYTLEVPFRADTWTKVRIVDVEEPNSSNDFNYLSLDTGLLHLNNYKTIKTYGKKCIMLDNELLIYIKKWWEKNAVFLGNPFKFLVPNNSGSKMSAHSFNARLKTIFGVGSRHLRHSYITYKRRLGANDREMKEIASRMNTSFVQTSITYDDSNHIFDSDSD